MKTLMMVIFGASGDLSYKKLFPALYTLYRQGHTPDGLVVLATARTGYTDETFRIHLRRGLPDGDSSACDGFLNRIHFYRMDPMDEEAYHGLAARIRSEGVGELLFYLATPPMLFGMIPRGLEKAGLLGCGADCRIVVEKPFGQDLLSARRLNGLYRKLFPEKAIFRMDHFLGKETVQNLLVLRFGNRIFETLWDGKYISHIEITAVEREGIDSRGAYFDGTGTLRDMVQNHLLQLLALVAMEPPADMEADTLRDGVAEVCRSLRPLSTKDFEKNVVRGQYLGHDGRCGYREEKGIHPDSRTETFVAMRLYVDTPRWHGTPFYLRTGKCMPTKVTEIVLHFRPSAFRLFAGEADRLIIRVQPDEGMVLRFALKEPGNGFRVKPVDMEFSYSGWSDGPLPDAYSRLLEDCLAGDSTFFARADAVEAGWRFLTPLLDHWREHPEVPLYGYPAGSWGPVEADRLIEGDGMWSNPCKNLTNTRLYCEL